MRTHLVIVDPGLREAGGHHAGFAAAVAAEHPFRGEHMDLRFVANRQVHPQVAGCLEAAGCVVERHFSINYYEFADKPGTLASRNPYIRRLCGEYLAMFRRLAASFGRDEAHFLYHTMSWEHLAALALSLHSLGEAGSRFRHVVCLMFGFEGGRRDVRLQVDYLVALKSLLECPGVEIHASCLEYAEAYAALLCLPRPLPIHACFLITAQDRLRVASSRRSAGTAVPYRARIVLYLGDAKASKGFLALPGLVEGLLPWIGKDGRLVIQCTYVASWVPPNILATVKALQRLAAGESRIELSMGFWSDAELKTCLAEADLLVFNYDDEAYRDKTSGLLWLACYYGISLVCIGENWLAREARRLAHWLKVFRTLDEFLADVRTSTIAFAAGTPDQEYRSRLFREFTIFPI